VYWFHHNDVAETTAFAGVQLVFAVANVGVTVTLEYWVTSHISALWDAESMVGSFRRMLRGVCDGEVLLREDMTICENPECIKHLLMTHHSFKGRHFQQLLLPDEVERFTGFMKQSTHDMLVPEDSRTSTPPCLRVSLRGASDIRVGVDLWHVPMPHLFGKDGAHHLLALREDWEARKPPEAKQSEQIERIPTKARASLAGQTGTRATSEAGSQAGFLSQSSYNSLMQNFPELVDMTLLVDGSTHWLDVEQAHLRFVKRPSDPDACMPSLRRLVRPTDWESVRSKLRSIMKEVEHSEEAQNFSMKLHMLDNSKRTVIANDVQVSAFFPPRAPEDDESIDAEVKLCLQITDIAFDDSKKKAAPSLLGIGELDCLADDDSIDETTGLPASPAATL